VICALPTPWMARDAKKWVAHVVAWSLTCICDGRWPHTDHLGDRWPQGSQRADMAGTPLAQGIRGCLVDCRGDWPHQASFFDVPYHNSVPEMCWLCHATHGHGPRPFTDVSAAAAWRASPKTTTEFEQSHRVGNRNAVCLTPGWHLEMIRVDECHAVKLGVARWTTANTILDLAEQGLWGATPLQQQLDTAWCQFTGWSRRHRIQSRVRRFTRARLGLAADDYPEASTKAMDTRVVVAWLAEVLPRQHFALTCLSHTSLDRHNHTPIQNYMCRARR
jgi:hypothetical protein